MSLDRPEAVRGERRGSYPAERNREEWSMTRDCPGAARKGLVRQDAQVVFPTSERSFLVWRRTSPSHFEGDGMAREAWEAA